MMPDETESILTPEQRQAGLFLAEDADHTLVLMQKRSENGVRKLPAERARFTQATNRRHIRNEAQRWVEKGELKC